MTSGLNTSNTFVPGINNSSFDYDARFQRMMDVLHAMLGELGGVRQEVAQLRQEVHSEFDYRARRPWHDVIVKDKSEPMHIRQEVRQPTNLEASDEQYLDDVKW